MKLIGDTSCERVDKYISLNSCLSRNKVLEMIDKELVLVNGKPADNVCVGRYTE